MLQVLSSNPLCCSRITSILLMALLFNCQNFNSSSQSSSDNISNISKDTFFEQFVQYIDSTGLNFNNERYLNQLRVDLRLIKPEYVDSEGLKAAHFETINSLQRQQRTTFLKTLGIISANIIRDERCVGIGGLPPPPTDSTTIEEYLTSQYPSYCHKRGFFITIAFSYPVKVANKKCNTDNSEIKKIKDCLKVRAFELTSYSKMYYDVYLVPKAKINWQIVRKKRVGGWISSIKLNRYRNITSLINGTLP